MDKSEEYLLHTAGIYAMLGWIEDQKNSGTPVKINNQTIFLHPLTSRYFSIGVSKNKKLAKTPFLAVQPNEAIWMKLIQWDKFCIKEHDLHLYLVSKLIVGDGIEFPDIPPFAVAISFDTIEKINILANIPYLDGREYYKENATQYFKDNKINNHEKNISFVQEKVMINLHSKLFDSIKIKKLSMNEFYLENNLNYIKYSDILTNKENNLQNTFLNGAPIFQGDEREAKFALSGFFNRLNKEKEKWLNNEKNKK
jgi:hypothetical protein